MKGVKQTMKIELEVHKDEIIKDKYIHYECVSSKLKALEEQNNTQYKAMRNKFYNSSFGGKYNLATVCGLKCLDLENPMKAKASLELSFKVVD